MFNAYLMKRGWRDSFTEALEQMKRERGFQNRTNIRTFLISTRRMKRETEGKRLNKLKSLSELNEE
jgi:hypothetical protein